MTRPPWAWLTMPLKNTGPALVIREPRVVRGVMRGFLPPHCLTHAIRPSLTTYALSSPATSSPTPLPVPFLNHPQPSTSRPSNLCCLFKLRMVLPPEKELGLGDCQKPWGSEEELNVRSQGDVPFHSTTNKTACDTRRGRGGPSAGKNIAKQWQTQSAAPQGEKTHSTQREDGPVRLMCASPLAPAIPVPVPVSTAASVPVVPISPIATATAVVAVPISPATSQSK